MTFLERLVEVDDPRPETRSDAPHLGDHLAGDDRLANPPTVPGDGHGLRKPHGRPGRKRAEMIDHRDQVSLERCLVLPVLRLRVIRSELDDDDVRLELGGLGERRLLDVGQVAVTEERRATHAEVSNLVRVAQELTEDPRVVVFAPLFDAGTVRDAVADARHANARSRIGESVRSDPGDESERERADSDRPEGRPSPDSQHPDPPWCLARGLYSMGGVAFQGDDPDGARRRASATRGVGEAAANVEALRGEAVRAARAAGIG